MCRLVWFVCYVGFVIIVSFVCDGVFCVCLCWLVCFIVWCCRLRVLDWVC